MEEFINQLQAGYHWQLSLITSVAIIATTMAMRAIGVMLVPAFRESSRINKDTYREKMQKLCRKPSMESKMGSYFLAGNLCCDPAVHPHPGTAFSGPDRP